MYVSWGAGGGLARCSPSSTSSRPDIGRFQRRPHSVFFDVLLAEEIGGAAGNNIEGAQAQRGASDQASGTKLVGEGLLPAAGDDKVGGAPGRGDAGRVGGEAVEVEVRGEEQDGGEEHGQLLQGSDVLGCQQGCEQGGRHR